MRCTPAVLLVLVLAAALRPSPATATILTFDQARDSATQTIVVPAGSGGVLPGDYGDNVTSAAMAVPGGVFTYGDGGEGFTPDVTVDFFTSLATPSDSRIRLWQSGYGDLANVIFGEGPGTAGSPIIEFVLTAAAGFVVDFYGLDLAGFGSDYTIASVEVFGNGAALFAQANVLVDGTGGHTTFAFATPLSSQEIRVRIDVSNLAPGIQDNIGVDSVRFGQTPPRVPEPALELLAALGTTLTLLGRSRSRG